MNFCINQPFGKLNPNELQSIRHMVREFCSTHDADSIYIALWDMLKYALCSTETSDWDEQKRAEYIFIFETLAQLIEASYALEDLWEKESGIIFCLLPNCHEKVRGIGRV